MKTVALLVVLAIVAQVAFATYVPIPANTRPCLSLFNDIPDEIYGEIVKSTNEADFMLAGLAPLPIAAAAPLLKAKLSAWRQQYLTDDFVFDAPVDGYHVVGPDAFVCWNVDQFQAYRLKYQSHVYGGATCQTIINNPLKKVVQINITLTVSGFTENRNYSPWPFGQMDKLVSSDLHTHIVYQFRRDGLVGGWKQSYKNEDFSKLVVYCQHNCTYPGAAAHCQQSNGGPCITSSANPNVYLNPIYPNPPGYFPRQPTVIWTNSTC